MSRWPDREADEGKRSIALSLSNAVFAQLVKLGRQAGQTPQRFAQTLFEEAYAARCMGKSAAAQVAAAGDMADAIEDDLSQQLAEARTQAKHAQDTIAGKDRMLLDQADTIRRLTAEFETLREAAKGQLVVVNQASEILRRDAQKREPVEILPPSAEENRLKVAGLQRTLAGMKAAGNTIREIARETGLSEKAVRQALGPLP